MTRALIVTLGASLVSVAAATTLLAVPASGMRTVTCASQWFVVATGQCPPDKVAYCKSHTSQSCGFDEEYTTCQNNTEGFALFCQSA